MYIVNTIKNKNSTGNILLLPKLAMFGHIYHKIWGYFSQGKCNNKLKKEKFSRSQKNEVRRVIFLFMKMLFLFNVQ